MSDQPSPTDEAAGEHPPPGVADVPSASGPRPVAVPSASGPRPVAVPSASGPRPAAVPPAPPPAPNRPHKGWHSRGYHPHFDKPGLVQGITFRLHDSVPREVLDRWRLQLEIAETAGSSPDDRHLRALRKRITRYEDAGYGQCWLAERDIATLAENALLYFDARRYRLLAWCVMPNHVHVLIETFEGYPLGDVVHSWKSFTAKEANKRLRRGGEFWMADYFDRYIRDERHLAITIQYIEQNPVKARLVRRTEEWRYSSAWLRVGGGGTAAGRGPDGRGRDVRYPRGGGGRSGQCGGEGGENFDRRPIGDS